MTVDATTAKILSKFLVGQCQPSISSIQKRYINIVGANSLNGCKASYLSRGVKGVPTRRYFKTNLKVVVSKKHFVQNEGIRGAPWLQANLIVILLKDLTVIFLRIAVPIAAFVHLSLRRLRYLKLFLNSKLQITYFAIHHFN